jgi:hypothetical protein
VIFKETVCRDLRSSPVSLSDMQKAKINVRYATAADNILLAELVLQRNVDDG